MWNLIIYLIGRTVTVTQTLVQTRPASLDAVRAATQTKNVHAPAQQIPKQKQKSSAADNKIQFHGLATHRLSIQMA